MFRILNFEFRESEGASPFKEVITLFFAILGSLCLGGLLLVFISKVDPFKAYWALLYGAFGSKYLFSETLVRTIILTFMGLATTVCFRAQIWNIGGDGQLFSGALLATVVSLYVDFLPRAGIIVITLVVSAGAGALWAGIAGVFRARYGLNEIFVTLMMNYIMSLFSIYLLEEIWREKTWGMPWTETFPERSWWPTLLQNTNVHMGLIVAVLSAISIYYLLFHTPFGYEIRALGLNPKASEIKGVNVSRIIMKAMLIAGMLAGVAGAGQVCGVTHRFVMDINPGYGFTGIIVALMGRLNPLGVMISALFIGALLNGAFNMEAVMGVPNALIDSIQGIILISVISSQILSKYRISKMNKYE